MSIRFSGSLYNGGNKNEHILDNWEVLERPPFLFWTVIRRSRIFRARSFTWRQNSIRITFRLLQPSVQCCLYPCYSLQFTSSGLMFQTCVVAVFNMLYYFASLEPSRIPFIDPCTRDLLRKWILSWNPLSKMLLIHPFSHSAVVYQHFHWYCLLRYIFYHVYGKK